MDDIESETDGKRSKRHKLELKKLRQQYKLALSTVKSKLEKKKIGAKFRSEEAFIIAQNVESLVSTKSSDDQQFEANCTLPVLSLAENEKALPEDPVTDNKHVMYDEQGQIVKHVKIFPLSKSQKKRQLRQEQLKAQTERFKEEAAGMENVAEVEMNEIMSQLDIEQLQIKTVSADGNCLFRALEDQILLLINTSAYHDLIDRFGTYNITGVDHRTLRRTAADFIEKHADDFAAFIPYTDVKQYCDTMRFTNEYGGEIEIRAISEMLQFPITVYSDKDCKYTYGTDFSNGHKPLNLSFHKRLYALGHHYNSVVPKIIIQ